MKKVLLLCSLLLCIGLLSGCSGWMNGGYFNVTPNHPSQEGQVVLNCEVVSVDDINYYVDLPANPEGKTIVFKAQEETVGYIWDFGV